MPVKDCQTEELIIDTAMQIFFVEGRIQATTQEIADAAGVNRTLINYYFRSKKELITKLMENARKEFSGNSDVILLSDLPFREKTEHFIEDFLNRQMKYPYLEPFITLNAIKERFSKDKSASALEQPEAIHNYLNEIENEMEKGTIPKYNPEHFLTNLFSLIIHPFIAKPLQMKLLNMTEKQYSGLITERKEVIIKTIFLDNHNQ